MKHERFLEATNSRTLICLPRNSRPKGASYILLRGERSSGDLVMRKELGV